MTLTNTQQQALRSTLESGLPLSAHPYHTIAEQLQCAESDVIEQIHAWHNNKLIKRFGVVVRHHALGYRFNAMCVWDVPENQVDAAGDCLSQRPEVTLCYQRRRQLPDWPYNLFCMIHGTDRALVERQIRCLNCSLGLAAFPHEVLFSTRQFKQRGGRYTAQGAQHASV